MARNFLYLFINFTPSVAAPELVYRPLPKNPLDVPEIRSNTFGFLPRTSLTSLTLVSHEFYSTAREHLAKRLNIRERDRTALWEFFRANRAPDTIPRATTAIIDLALDPGEIVAALMFSCTDNIDFVEFLSTSKQIPGWSLEMADQILPTLVYHLPHATKFVVYALSTRLQFELIRSGSSRLTSLELHSPLQISTRYATPVIDLPELLSLHLIHATSYTNGTDFLVRTAVRFTAPKLATLTVGNGLTGSGHTIQELVRHFAPRLTKLILVDNRASCHNDEIARLPPLPHLRHLEVDMMWASAYVGGLANPNAPDFPSLHTLVFQATPESVVKGLPGCRWSKIWSGLNAVADCLQLIECAYRAHDCTIRDSFRLLVQDHLLKVAPQNPLRGPWTIRESFRDPLPSSPYLDEDSSAWGHDD
ncbi:hypothetical protein V5O48_017060 [Marasmius crinis-equi]|uniref:F-box domain-containing protein n=1 Tax=Marasmius crinis-equi TaxID=585013 RepID=A0ABR3EQ00_9AGAR